MQSTKPYLRLVESSEEFNRGVWKSDGLLVVSRTVVFQDRCVICNKPADGRTFSKTLFWHSPLLLPLLVLSFPFYLLFAIFFKRVITVNFPICRKHRLIRSSLTLFGSLLIPSVLFFGIYAVQGSSPVWILLGILGTLLGMGILGYARNPVWAMLIRGDYAVVRGADPDFVEACPDWDNHIELS